MECESLKTEVAHLSYTKKYMVIVAHNTSLKQTNVLLSSTHDTDLKEK